MKSIIIILLCGYQTVLFGQLLNHSEIEENGIIFNYQTDYEKTIKKNKVKRATTSYIYVGSVVEFEIHLYLNSSCRLTYLLLHRDNQKRQE